MTNSRYYICVTPFFPEPNAVYGAYILDQVKAIQRNSDYEVIVFKPKSLLRKHVDYTYDGIRVHLFTTVYTPSYIFNGITDFINRRLFLRALAEHNISLDDISIIHCHTGSFATYGVELKSINKDIKVLLQHHDKDPYQVLYGKGAGWLPNLYFRAWIKIRDFKKVDYHICISKCVEENLLTFPKQTKSEKYAPYSKRLQQARFLKNDTTSFKTIKLYNGVDTLLFNKNFKKNKDTKVFTIGCIGNYIYLKRHIILLKAIDRIVRTNAIPNLKVRLIGHGPLENELKNYVETHNLYNVVEFEEEVEHNNLPDFYRSLDLFVLTSVFEGMGCVYLEAAACGVPFIMCEGQGAQDFLGSDECNKWIIEPDDYLGLADKIVNYYHKRYQQSINQSFDIDLLIRDFLKKITS